MGHVRNYALGDVVARFKRAKGFNVLHPMGWDAFGLPAENAAIERGVHPGKWTIENIAAMRAQLKTMGLSYDWDREVTTCSPDYYKHEQKMFLDFLKAGLAYRKLGELGIQLNIPFWQMNRWLTVKAGVRVRPLNGASFRSGSCPYLIMLKSCWPQLRGWINGQTACA